MVLNETDTHNILSDRIDHLDWSARDIANARGTNVRTTQDILTRSKRRGTIDPQNPPGRPLSMSERHRRQLARDVDLPFLVFSRPCFDDVMALFNQFGHALPEVQVSENIQQGDIDEPDEPHWTKAQLRPLRKKKQNVIIMPNRVAWNELQLPQATMDALFPNGVTPSDRHVEIEYGVFGCGCESLGELTVRVRRPNGLWYSVDDEAVLKKVWGYFLLLRKEDEEAGRPWADGLTYTGLSG